MKRLLCLTITLLMVLSLFACGESGGKEEQGQFTVGFGRVDVTPEQGVHLASYGDADTRISEGALHPLYVHTIAMTDEDGNTVLIITTDLSQGNWTLMNEVRPMILEKFGITSDYVMIGGTHNHNAPDYGYNDTYDQIWKEIFKEGIMESIQIALDDRAPATVEIGRTETENLTFVRRYYLANGEMTGDNYNYNHNSTITAHETEADEEMQLVRFVRDADHKDIVMVNWQAHAAKHGHTNYISADYVGPLRDKIDEELGVYTVFYQGAAGNLNPSSRIPGECSTGSGYAEAVKHGELVADVAIKALTTEGVMQTIETGEIRTTQTKFIGATTWDEANAIVCGDLSFVTLPVEFYDSLGKTIKDETPYDMTVLLGYHCGNGQYLATMQGYINGGYGPTNTRYRAGEGEKFVEFYLDLLNEMYAAQ